MPLRLVPLLLVVALATSASAQTRVRTETIRPLSTNTKAVDILADMSKLPAPVAQMRERILAAARSGDLRAVAALMKSKDGTTIFSSSDARDPIDFWRESYPDSGGIEALSILISILETPCVHVEPGTQQDMYLWPYFARMPLRDLTPEQKVELFRIVTGSDYKDMLETGAYSFYRVGIGSDGNWQLFVAGD